MRAMDRFDELVVTAQKGGAPKAWCVALANVADTAFICRTWLELYAPNFTPADLLAMTKMVFQREDI